MTIFLILIIVWAILLFGGFLTGSLNPGETHRIPTPARMGASFVLVLFAWAWFLFATPGQSAVFQNLALYIAIGMTCGFIGDLFMAKNIVPGGISAFGIGHLFYIAGLIQTASTLALIEYRPIS
ncbi:MAG: lysoplasmalogenase family protein, partial [Aggregatilineales bacterium]